MVPFLLVVDAWLRRGVPNRADQSRAEQNRTDVDELRLILLKPLRYGFYLRVDLLMTNTQG